MATWAIDNNVLSISGAEGVLGTGDNNSLVIETNNTPRVWVNPSGNVGLGTSAPSSQLHINVAGSPNPISALTIDVQSFDTGANALASHFLLVHDIDAAPPNGVTHLAVRGDGYVGIGTATPSARLSVVLPNTTEIGNTAHSNTLLTSSGALGEAAGNEVALASFGLTVTNDLTLGVRAIRTSQGADWNSTAIGLGMDVDDTVRAGAAIFLHADGNVGIGTSTPAAKLDIAGGALHIDVPANPTTITTPVQGAYVTWNALNGHTGETDFINNQGLGTGGFAFMNTPASGTPRTTLMTIGSEGTVTIFGPLLIANPNNSGQFINVGVNLPIA